MEHLHDFAGFRKLCLLSLVRPSAELIIFRLSYILFNKADCTLEHLAWILELGLHSVTRNFYCRSELLDLNLTMPHDRHGIHNVD